MAGEFKEMAGDLSKLLEEVKVKPIIVKEETAKPVATPQTPTVDTHELAREIVAEVFSSAPKGVKSEDVGLTLLFACDTAAKACSISKELVFEAVMRYCIGAIETAQLHEEIG